MGWFILGLRHKTFSKLLTLHKLNSHVFPLDDKMLNMRGDKSVKLSQGAYLLKTKPNK